MILAIGVVTLAQAPTPSAGRGHGGPEFLAGGPQADDPAYANVDFSKKTPGPALSPEQELTCRIASRQWAS
jgi:hypothetical protein